MNDFVASSSSALAAICIMHPFDVVKTRLQMQGEVSAGSGCQGDAQPRPYRGIFRSLTRIAAAEGTAGLYAGLAPASLLQISVTGTRFTVYGTLQRTLDELDKSEGSSSMLGAHARNFILAMAAGVAGATAGNPFYMLKTQYQSVRVGTSASSSSSFWQAFLRIGEHRGLRGYWLGLDAFMPRVVAYSSMQLATYDSAKRVLLKHTDLAPTDLRCHAGASAIAAGFAVGAMQPFDFIAARLMNQPIVDGRPQFYSGPLDCALKTISGEGFMGLMKGVGANYARMGPYTVLVLVFFEQLKPLVNRVL
eukprot:TRINITY_DN63089_c0_g1_i1.p1 TRINITY_DN63089_c0_g1~~TRINITY_DN63089_c0_g1_i1.p1  ORF type:complete len:320 (+),score=32.26 TRINITY_DN63089_c0_g1_i1:44-961(+)